MWYVENVARNGKKVRKYFDTYEEAREYSQWTLGYIGKEKHFESEKDMKYTYEELQIMFYETEKALDVMVKIAEFTNEFLTREDVKPLFRKFLIEKANK